VPWRLPAGELEAIQTALGRLKTVCWMCNGDSITGSDLACLMCRVPESAGFRSKGMGQFMHECLRFGRFYTLDQFVAKRYWFLRGGKHVFTSCLAGILLAGLSGCASIQVHMGMKVYLAKAAVTSIEISQPKGPGIAPGQKSSLMVTVTQPNGKTLLTEGAGHGKVMWRDLAVTTTVVTVNTKGVIALGNDPRKSDGKLPQVTITVPSHPEIHAELDIPLRYDYKFGSNFSGSSGSNGFSGTNGTDGISGSPGSTDPDHPSAGGNGTNGGNGSDGGNGGDGGDAPPVQVLVTLRAGGHPLLQAEVSAGTHHRYYLVDPQGGSLTVSADGGEGGTGGKGGSGGRGGSGGIGSPNGSSGSDGSSGNDGRSGSQGRGGLITVTYDPQVKPYLSTIRLSSQNGPHPVYQEQTVAPLW